MFRPDKFLLVEEFIRIRQRRSRILRGRSSTETAGQPQAQRMGRCGQATGQMKDGAGQGGVKKPSRNNVHHVSIETNVAGGRMDKKKKNNMKRRG